MNKKVLVNTDKVCILIEKDNNKLIRVDEIKETFTVRKVGLPTLVILRNKIKEAVKKGGLSTLANNIEKCAKSYKKAGSHTNGPINYLKYKTYLYLIQLYYVMIVLATIATTTPVLHTYRYTIPATTTYPHHTMPTHPTSPVCVTSLCVPDENTVHIKRMDRETANTSVRIQMYQPACVLTSGYTWPPGSSVVTTTNYQACSGVSWSQSCLTNNQLVKMINGNRRKVITLVCGIVVEGLLEEIKIQV